MEFIRVAYYPKGQLGPIVHPIAASDVESAIAATEGTIAELTREHSLLRLELLEPTHHRLVAQWDGAAWTRSP